MRHWIGGVAAVVLAIAAVQADPAGQAPGRVAGTVVDTLGAPMVAVSVVLLRDGETVNQTTSGADGAFSFAGLVPDRYQVRAAAQGFATRTSEPVFVGTSDVTTVEIVLDIGPFEQNVVVTAGAVEQLQSRTGAPVTVIDRATLESLNALDVQDALRLVPGAQVVQVGQRGAPTSLFLRGGNANFTKVLLDGIPANDIGGDFDFSRLSLAGVDGIEVLRQTNSVMYGSDALAGVVNITTQRGSSRIPDLHYAADGGNLGSFNHAVSVGGAVKRVDYFSEYSYGRTDNSTPNSGYRNGTFAGRLGVAIGGSTNVSGTVRRIDGSFGSANAFSLFRIADDSVSDTGQTFLSVAADSQLGPRWQTTVRFGASDQRLTFTNPAPTGEPFDPFGFGANYLGQTVTLTGADGATVTGRAILDFGGVYPSVFRSRTTRRLLTGQATFELSPSVAISGGGRVEQENAYGDPGADPSETRNNGGGFIEGRASLEGRLYLVAGVGVEHNAAFETAYTPRLSVAAYLRSPSADRVGETKVTLNVGKGIKAPTVFQAQNSLYRLVAGTPAGDGLSPIAPERSRSVDVGLEQAFAGARLRARAGYFNNRFENLLEFLSRTALVQAGVPADVAAATAFGAYVNSASFDAQGLELSADAVVAGVHVSGSYTYLDAEVTEAFGAGAVFNPLLPGMPIGAFSPLVGQRPFRRPTNSGTLLVRYAAGPVGIALAGYFSGARDDSTFLTDAFFGNSLLLPNQNLDAAYQRFDVSGSYRVSRRLSFSLNVDNVLDRSYEGAFGYPSLPLTARAGLSVTIGGD